MHDCYLTILGSNSALPTLDRHPSAQYLFCNGLNILIDCGEGTQIRLLQYKISAMKLDIILISHLHGDHVFGLPGLLTSYILLKRVKPLKIIGPIGIKGFLESIFQFTYTTIPYPIEIIETDYRSKSRVFENNSCYIDTLPLIHSIPCNGYLISEKYASYNLDKSKLNSYDLNIAEIKMLKSQIPVIRADETIIDPTDVLYLKRSLASYAYCSDTAYSPELADLITGVEILYHEATYADEFAMQANERGHSTASQAASIAEAANAKRLLIGHPSSKYKTLDLLLTEARAIFPKTDFAEEGTTYFC